MGPTETRSRDQWLAEVKRRGGRLRRRRRLIMALGAALALVVPVSALATLLGAPDRDVRQVVAGPAPAGDVAGGSNPSIEPGPTDAAEPGPGVVETTVPELRVEAVHGRTGPPAPSASPFVAPASPGSIPPSDDPVVRPTTTVAATGNTSSPVLPPNQSTPGATPGDSAPCPASEVAVTVSTEKRTYGPGAVVRGSSTLENRSATACLLPTRAFVRIVDSAGKDVSGFAYTMEFRYPVRAEPGKTFSSSFTWDQRDCSGPACTQVPPGTYTVVADWSESGPYAGRSTFQVVS